VKSDVAKRGKFSWQGGAAAQKSKIRGKVDTMYLMPESLKRRGGIRLGGKRPRDVSER